MAVSDAHKRASYKYNTGRDNIMIRPTKEEGEQIRAAAAAAGQSVQAYILGRISGRGDAPAAPQYITPEALDQATQAAQAAGEELDAWIARAISDTAARDQVLRQMLR